MEILARFANQNENLKESDYMKEKSELGNVYLPVNGMKYSDTVMFDLTKFLWMPRITVDGVRLA